MSSSEICRCWIWVQAMVSSLFRSICAIRVFIGAIPGESLDAIPKLFGEGRNDKRPCKPLSKPSPTVNLTMISVATTPKHSIIPARWVRPLAVEAPSEVTCCVNNLLGKSGLEREKSWNVSHDSSQWLSEPIYETLFVPWIQTRLIPVYVHQFNYYLMDTDTIHGGKRKMTKWFPTVIQRWCKASWGVHYCLLMIWGIDAVHNE